MLTQDEPDAAPANSGRSGARGRVAMYADLFRAPGTMQFVTAGFVGRLATSMSGLGLVLALSGPHGYGTAGSIAGLFGLASSVAAPQVGRLHDRHGQSRVLPPLALAFGGLLGLLMCALAFAWPTWTLFPLAVGSGAALPIIGSLVRARWTAIYGGSERLRTCYALEGATDEAVYIVGPILVTMLSTSVGALAGLGAVLACATCGTFALAAQRGTEPKVAHTTGEPGGRAGALRVPAVRLIVAVMTGAGGVFGSMEIVTVGFASAHGDRAASGLLLGIWGAGSLVAGLIYGAVTVRGSAHRRFEIAVGGFAAGLIPLMFAGSLTVLAGLLVVAGIFMSLTMVTSIEVLERVVSARALTEGLSWVTGGIGLGMTAGSLAGGWLMDEWGEAHGYLVPAGFAMLSLLVILADRRRLANVG